MDNTKLEKQPDDLSQKIEQPSIESEKLPAEKSTTVPEEIQGKGQPVTDEVKIIADNGPIETPKPEPNSEKISVPKDPVEQELFAKKIFKQAQNSPNDLKNLADVANALLHVE